MKYTIGINIDGMFERTKDGYESFGTAKVAAKAFAEAETSPGAMTIYWVRGDRSVLYTAAYKGGAK